jgi:hypothetical protein
MFLYFFYQSKPGMLTDGTHIHPAGDHAWRTLTPPSAAA